MGQLIIFDGNSIVFRQTLALIQYFGTVRKSALVCTKLILYYKSHVCAVLCCAVLCRLQDEGGTQPKGHSAGPSVLPCLLGVAYSFRYMSPLNTEDPPP